jgi:hypothetical protein
VGFPLLGGVAVRPAAGVLILHAGNCVLALMQVVLTRLPFVSYHYQVRHSALSIGCFAVDTGCPTMYLETACGLNSIKTVLHHVLCPVLSATH